MDNATQKRAGIVGGAFLPHAPQFFTQPETEPKDTLKRVQDVARGIGEKLKAMRPDVWIIIGNDHAQQFFYQCAPAFTLHVGGRGIGRFAGRDFDYEIDSALSFALVRKLYDLGFDPAFTSVAEIDYAMGIPLTHLGVDGPIVPLYVNAYLPPQPNANRCFAFGKALRAAVETLGVRAVIVASGGMSHFPGTDRYANPDLDFDMSVLEEIRQGRLEYLAGLDPKLMDDTGNIELRCWAVAAGALGNRVPDLVQMDPSWHHNYASVGFLTEFNEIQATPHYSSIAPEHLHLIKALHGLAYDAQAVKRYLASPEAYADEFELPASQRQSLVALDRPGITRLGVHPLIVFMADMAVKRMEQARQATV